MIDGKEDRLSRIAICTTELHRFASLLLVALAILLASPAFDAVAGNDERPALGHVTIVLYGVAAQDGDVRVALFSDADSKEFPYGVGTLRQILAPGRVASVQFHDVPHGRYAAVAFQDLNANGVLDLNVFGIPKEPWGVSGDRPFGRAPRYAESTFQHSRDDSTTITIDLR